MYLSLKQSLYTQKILCELLLPFSICEQNFYKSHTELNRQHENCEKLKSKCFSTSVQHKIVQQRKLVALVYPACICTFVEKESNKSQVFYAGERDRILVKLNYKPTHTNLKTYVQTYESEKSTSFVRLRDFCYRHMICVQVSGGDNLKSLPAIAVPQMVGLGEGLSCIHEVKLTHYLFKISLLQWAQKYLHSCIDDWCDLSFGVGKTDIRICSFL